MQFAALDFETANHKSDSACQLAIVVVENAQIIQEHCWLIRPSQMYFSERCIAVHGILPRHCMDQPEWDRLWPQILQVLDGRVLIAHNAAFDLRVLVSTMQSYELACPELEYTCTRLIARRTWPGRDGYGLMPTATALGFTFRHHDALEDARVCAKIALAAAQQLGVSTLEELEQQLSITRGKVRFGVLANPRCIRKSRKVQNNSPSPGNRKYHADGMPRRIQSGQQPRLNLESIVEQCQCQGLFPLANRCIVLQGTLLGVDRHDAVRFLQQLGAIVQDQMDQQTSYLVMGSTSESAASPILQAGSNSSDPGRQIDQGQPIRILSQRQLFALIPGAPEAARAIATGRTA